MPFSTSLRVFRRQVADRGVGAVGVDPVEVGAAVFARQARRRIVGQRVEAFREAAGEVVREPLDRPGAALAEALFVGRVDRRAELDRVPAARPARATVEDFSALGRVGVAGFDRVGEPPSLRRCLVVHFRRGNAFAGDRDRPGFAAGDQLKAAALGQPAGVERLERVWSGLAVVPALLVATMR